VLGPAIIATAHRGVRHRDDLSARERGAALVAQWIGAYLGYALGGAAGLGLLATLWLVGLLSIIPPPGPRLLFIGVLLAALLCSYTAARSQVRAALVIAPRDPTIFSHTTAVLVIVAMLTIVLAPFGLLTLPATPLRVLLDPAPGALALAIVVLSLVLFGR